MDDAEGSKAAAAKLLAACEDGIDMTGVAYDGKDLTAMCASATPARCPRSPG